MPTARNVRFDDDLWDAIRVTAARAGTNPSAWLRAVARASLDPGLDPAAGGGVRWPRETLEKRCAPVGKPRRCRHPLKHRLVNVCLACGKTIQPPPTPPPPPPRPPVVRPAPARAQPPQPRYPPLRPGWG